MVVPNLCQTCAKLVDNDVNRYSKEILSLWKEKAESKAFEELVKSQNPQESLILSENDVRICDTIVKIFENNDTVYMLKKHDYHNDFEIRRLTPLGEFCSSYEMRINCPENEVLREMTNYLWDKTMGFFNSIDLPESKDVCNRNRDYLWKTYETFLNSYKKMV